MNTYFHLPLCTQLPNVIIEIRFCFIPWKKQHKIMFEFWKYIFELTGHLGGQFIYILTGTEAYIEFINNSLQEEKRPKATPAS